MRSRRVYERERGGFVCISSMQRLLYLFFLISATRNRTEMASAFAVHDFVSCRGHLGQKQHILLDRSHFSNGRRGAGVIPRTTLWQSTSTTLSNPNNNTFFPQEDTLLRDTIAKTAATASPVIKDSAFVRHIFSCLFCFSSGFGDVKAVRNYGGPINMCTGSIIRVMLAIIERSWGDFWIPGLQVVFFMLGSMTSRLTQKAVESPRQCLRAQELKQNKWSLRFWLLTVRSRLCLAVIPLILGVFGFATWNHQCQRSCVAAQAFGYGLINTAAQEVTGGPVVFALTGHVMAASTATVDTAASASSVSVRTVFMRSSLIISFVLGVAGAVFLWDYLLPQVQVSDRLEYVLMGVWYSIIFAFCSRQL